VNRLKLSVLALALAAAPAAAQPAPATSTIAPGMIVKHDKGSEVGTVVRIEGDLLIVKTDKYEVPVPKTSTTPFEGTLLFGMTRDQLNAAVEAQNAARDAAMKVGASVLDPAGAAAGTVTATDAESLTLKVASGKVVRLPRTGFALGANGLVVGLTAAQLEAAASGSSTK
jgi:hypothetical protein